MIAISLGFAFLSILVTVTVTDLERREIPNSILAAGAVAGLAIIVPADPSSLPERAIAALGAGSFLMLGTLGGDDAMGMGDVKLAALIGLYLGDAVVVSLAVAFTAGAVAGLVLLVRHGAAGRKLTIPFGPFLAAGGVVGLWAGDVAVGWYLDAFLRE